MEVGVEWRIKGAQTSACWTGKKPKKLRLLARWWVSNSHWLNWNCSHKTKIFCSLSSLLQLKWTEERTEAQTFPAASERDIRRHIDSLHFPAKKLISQIWKQSIDPIENSNSPIWTIWSSGELINSDWKLVIILFLLAWPTWWPLDQCFTADSALWMKRDLGIGPLLLHGWVFHITSLSLLDTALYSFWLFSVGTSKWGVVCTTGGHKWSEMIDFSAVFLFWSIKCVLSIFHISYWGAFLKIYICFISLKCFEAFCAFLPFSFHCAPVYPQTESFSSGAIQFIVNAKSQVSPTSYLKK